MFAIDDDAVDPDFPAFKEYLKASNLSTANQKGVLGPIKRLTEGKGLCKAHQKEPSFMTGEALSLKSTDIDGVISCAEAWLPTKEDKSNGWKAKHPLGYVKKFQLHMGHYTHHQQLPSHPHLPLPPPQHQQPASPAAPGPSPGSSSAGRAGKPRNTKVEGAPQLFACAFPLTYIGTTGDRARFRCGLCPSDKTYSYSGTTVPLNEAKLSVGLKDGESIETPTTSLMKRCSNQWSKHAKECTSCKEHHPEVKQAQSGELQTYASEDSRRRKAEFQQSGVANKVSKYFAAAPDHSTQLTLRDTSSLVDPVSRCAACLSSADSAQQPSEASGEEEQSVPLEQRDSDVSWLDEPPPRLSSKEEAIDFISREVEKVDLITQKERDHMDFVLGKQKAREREKGNLFWNEKPVFLRRCAPLINDPRNSRQMSTRETYEWLDGAFARMSDAEYNRGYYGIAAYYERNKDPTSPRRYKPISPTGRRPYEIDHIMAQYLSPFDHPRFYVLMPSGGLNQTLATKGILWRTSSVIGMSNAEMRQIKTDMQNIKNMMKPYMPVIYASLSAVPDYRVAS